MLLYLNNILNKYPLETIKLKHEDQIKALDNCPSKANYDGDLVLFRWVKAPLTVDSFIPYSLHQEKLRNMCDAWGLSVYQSLEEAERELKNLTKRKRKKFNAIAICKISNYDGVKYQSGRNKKHFTFFPNEDFDCATKFNLINGDE